MAATTNNSDVCTICLEDLVEKGDGGDSNVSNSSLMTLPGCRHVYHTACFFDYMKRCDVIRWSGGRVTCPMCRGEVMIIPMAPPRLPATTIRVDAGRHVDLMEIEEEIMSRRAENCIKNLMLCMSISLVWFLLFGAMAMDGY